MRTATLGLIGCSALMAWPLRAQDSSQPPSPVAAYVSQLQMQHDSFDAAAAKDQIGEDLRTRRRQVNQQDVASWRKLDSAEDWEPFAAERITALRASLGEFPAPPTDLRVRVTRQIDGAGYRIDCLHFESRPGLLVTANLYRPVPREGTRKSETEKLMPGILICHSHHNPKTQGELQDMGIQWARAGCLVLVMDQLGHGERRQHPFAEASDFDGDFRVSRQDYYFRYNVGIHLHLIGDSLIGWMVWDLMRGVDLLLQQPGIDRRRIILLGAVAGGGDPCAVAAALDDRIAAAVPFNFGGPQPESIFPLPEDAELSFNYVGGGSWESTRNLQRSARDGFLPWVIVGRLAPRRLIYAHEFSWDQEKDPVWQRLQTIYDWYDANENLSSVYGYGRVQLSSNEASHCNNIGGYHRKQIYPALQRWFGMELPDVDFRERRSADELYAVQGVEAADVTMPSVHRMADAIARQRLDAFRRRLAELPAERRRETIRGKWNRLLGYREATIDGPEEWRTVSERPVRILRASIKSGTFTIPTLLLTPTATGERGCACVVAVAQQGGDGFLQHRSTAIANLIQKGIAVCLVDLPGCGIVAPDVDRGRRSSATSTSSGLLMLGSTNVGDRLRDLMTVVQAIRELETIDGERIAVWGDSFAPVNPPETRVAVPWGVAHPPLAEPLGPLLSLLSGLFDPQIRAVVARGGLVSMRSVLESPFIYIPHDVIIPGALTAGDLSDIATALAPRPVYVDGIIDGTNRIATDTQLSSDWPQLADARSRVTLHRESNDAYVQWLLTKLRQ